jgi:hypothetical protein
VALSAARLADFMATDLSALDHLVVQIDGLHLGDDLVLVAAIGVDGEGTVATGQIQNLILMIS